MKKAGKILGYSLTVLVTLLYLVSCLTPYLSTTQFPAGTLFSLAYLPILIAYALLVLTWVFIKKKIALLLALLFFCGYRNFSSTIALNITRKEWTWQKDTGTVRIMCWNVNRLGDPYIKADTPGSIRRKMLEFIARSEPDIFCVQDFTLNEYIGFRTGFVNNVNAVLAAGKFGDYWYPYYYEYDGPNYCDKMGVAIFSKFPILKTGAFSKNGEIIAEKALYADILVQQKTIRVFVAHLSSMGLWPNVAGEGGLPYFEGDSTKQRTSSVLSKLLYFGKVHSMDQSPYPVLFSGDLNSVPSGYVYRHLKKGLHDSFLENDFGVGGTYNMVFPKLRIDVLLHSREIEVTQYTRPAVELSDHYPIIADIRWKK